MEFSRKLHINSFNYEELEDIKFASLHQLSLIDLDAKSPEVDNLEGKIMLFFL